MKTTQSILERLTGLTPFRTLKQYRCYHRFMAMLPPRFRQAVGFVYIRRTTLYVALRHPGYKMELHYNKELLKSLLTTLADHDEGCRKLRADSVVLFNSKYSVEHPAHADTETVPRYHELAEGTFEDHSSNPDLHRQFERIRAAIRANRRRDA